MLDLRLVIDINVLVSATLKLDSLQRTVFLLAIPKPARLYVSAPVSEEYAEVLSRPELSIRKGARLELLQLIRNLSQIIVPSRRIEAAADPDDNIFLECADKARADFPITGNRRHFPVFWKSTKIIVPREFVNLAEPHLIYPRQPMRAGDRQRRTEARHTGANRTSGSSSSQLRCALEPPPSSTACSSSPFRCCIRSIFSSTLPTVTSR